MVHMIRSEVRMRWNLRPGFPRDQPEKAGGFRFGWGTPASSGCCHKGDNGGPNPMAYERNPNDPYRPNLADDELQRNQRLDRELQADPELGEGPASGGKVAMFAIAIAVVLGAVFYGLNNSSMNPAGTGSTATAPATQNTAQTAPAGMRDVTPRSNTEPGMTTGAAPARPAQPPAAAPTGQEMDRTAKPDSAAPDAPAKSDAPAK